MRKFIYRLRGLLALRIRKDFNFRRVQETIPAIRWLRPKRGERILDIGCGEGQVTRRLASHNSNVLGLDATWAQISVAASRANGDAYVRGSAVGLGGPSKEGSAQDDDLIFQSE